MYGAWVCPPLRRADAVERSVSVVVVFAECPRRDSNPRPGLRRPVLYPLSYGGKSPSQYNSLNVV